MDNNKPVRISDTVNSLTDNIFVTTEQLVAKYKPVNLGKGSPDFKDVVPEKLRSSLVATQNLEQSYEMDQYCRCQGSPVLLKEIAGLYSTIMCRDIEPHEVLITIGAIESLFCIIKTILNPADEVIIIEPFYVPFSTFVEICGGTCRFVPLRMKPGGVCANDFQFDEDELRQAFNSKTRAIIVNSPHNPTGKVFNLKEITLIADLCKKHNCLYISDEVYEWLQYDDGDHLHVATLPGMWERSVTIGSAGKSFNVTGWKIGWTIGPKYLISSALKLHSLIINCVATPLQVALADMFRQERSLLGTEKSYWYQLLKIMRTKREKIFKILNEAGLNPIMPNGGYFMMADISNVGIKLHGKSEMDKRVVEWLVTEKGVLGLPVSSFHSKENGPKFDKYVRFCFIKSDETIDAAEMKLKSL